MTPREKMVLYSYMNMRIAQAGVLDTRVLITQTVTTLTPLIPVNRHHAAGMLAKLKRSGSRKITVLVSHRRSIVF